MMENNDVERRCNLSPVTCNLPTMAAYPPIPEDDAARVAALRRYDILDTDPDPTFDRIAAAAAAVFDAPIAVINLVDELRGFFKARHGVELEGAPRDQMICSSVIMQDDVVVYADARIDPYTSRLPGVHAFDVGFYAAAPLHTADGYNLGTLCVIDKRPHEPTQKQKELLAGLAAVVIDEMELRLAARRLAEAEVALRRTNLQLEAANRNKSEFLARMSHELRTPLNAILGASELLGDGLFGELNDKQAEYVSDIHQSGRHLLGLINDILDLSKIESGRMELQPSVVSIAALMESSASIIRGFAASKSIQLALRTPPADAAFTADERKVKQIVYNLLSNAVKFTPDGGRIEFGAEMDHDGGVRVWVHDTGPGIPPEHAERIFEEFFQLPGEREGTGLGLAVARELVVLHGGKIWLDDSEAASGARFVFTLPARPASP
jgi:signal transduction histidine kinase